MIHMIELVNNDIKTIIATIYVLMKLEERMDMLSRYVGDINKSILDSENQHVYEGKGSGKNSWQVRHCRTKD